MPYHWRMPSGTVYTEAEDGRCYGSYPGHRWSPWYKLGAKRSHTGNYLRACMRPGCLMTQLHLDGQTHHAYRDKALETS